MRMDESMNDGHTHPESRDESQTQTRRHVGNESSRRVASHMPSTSIISYCCSEAVHLQDDDHHSSPT